MDGDPYYFKRGGYIYITSLISAESRVEKILYRTEREEIGFYQVLLGGCYSICREGHGDYLLHILLLKFFKNK